MIILKEDTNLINIVDKSSILNNIKPDIDSSLSAMSDFLSSQIISNELIPLTLIILIPELPSAVDIAAIVSLSIIKVSLLD